MKFRILYNSNVLPAEERRLSDEAIANRFSMLAGDLAVRLGPQGFVPFIEMVRDEIDQHAFVTLKNGGKGTGLKTMLGQCLSDINNRTPGLCFVGKEIKG